MSLVRSSPRKRPAGWNWIPAFADADSRRLALEIGFPLAERGEAVHHGAVVEGALGGGDVLGLPDQAFCGAACSARP